MKFLRETEAKNKSYREFKDSMWNITIGSGKVSEFSEKTFPFYYMEGNKNWFEKIYQKVFWKHLTFGYIEKYADYKKKLKELEKNEGYAMLPMEEREQVTRRIYEMEFMIYDAYTNSYSQEVSKTRVIDLDTWAYYSLGIQDVTNLVKAIIDGSAKDMGNWVIRAQVYPHARWRTCFLGIYNKEYGTSESDSPKEGKTKVPLWKLEFGKTYQDAYWVPQTYLGKVTYTACEYSTKLKEVVDFSEETKYVTVYAKEKVFRVFNKKTLAKPALYYLAKEEEKDFPDKTPEMVIDMLEKGISRWWGYDSENWMTRKSIQFTVSSFRRLNLDDFGDKYSFDREPVLTITPTK